MPQEPSLEEQRAFYDSWNQEKRSGGYDEIDPKVTVRTTAALAFIDALGLAPDVKILEVGCGTGWLSERLCAYGDVTGIDLSPGAIEIARSRGIDAEFVAADFLTFDLPEEPRFDLIVCAETLFYVEDQSAFVEKLAAATKPGGYAVFTMINKFVYERTEGIPPPSPGQIRSWLGQRATLRLLEPRFDIRKVRNLEPDGHGGILRLVNSYRLDALLERFVSRETLARARERLGFGSGFVVVCQRR